MNSGNEFAASLAEQPSFTVTMSDAARGAAGNVCRDHQRTLACSPTEKRS